MIFTALAYHNKCRSFTGSNGVFYRNELCFDDSVGKTAALEALANMKLNSVEESLLDQWVTMMDAAKQTANYDASLSYGTYQVHSDLNTTRIEMVGRKGRTVYDYPVLNGEFKTLKAMTMAYHADHVAPKLWKYGLLK